MFVFVVAALASPQANVVKQTDVGGHISFVGTLFVDDSLTDMDVSYNTSSTVSIYPVTTVKKFPVHLYTYRMKNLAKIEDGVTTSSISYSLLAPTDLPEFTLLIDIYRTNFVYLGKPPIEMVPHITEIGCTTPPSFGSGLDIKGTIGGTPVTISHSVSTHTIATPSVVCGNKQLIIGTTTSNIWVDCSSGATTGSTNTLSGVALGLGFYNSADSFCLYVGNNDELNHTLAITTVVVLFIFLSVWIDWTQNLWTRVVLGSTSGVWETTTVAFDVVVYQIISFIVSMNIYARAQRSHNIYSFSALRMVPMETVDRTSDIYSYVVTPLLGGICLLTMIIGRIKVGVRDEPSPFNFTWGWKAMENRPLGVRILSIVAVYGAIAAIVYAVWVRGINDEVGGIVTAITIAPVVLSWSTPRWVARHLVDVEINHLPPMLIFFSWSVKFLVITCLGNNLPFDVAGQLNTPFHSAITFAMGCALLGITGRDMAHILLCIRDLSRPKMGGLMVFFSGIVGFVLWYASIFSLGGMYSHSGALQNKGSLATICSLSFSIFLFCISFSISADDGISETITKGAKGL
jgi:hypothetical protein